MSQDSGGRREEKHIHEHMDVCERSACVRCKYAHKQILQLQLVREDFF